MDRRRRYVAAAAAMSGLAIALSAAAAPILAADQSVTIEGFAFSPATVTVNVGDTVTWTNNDGTAHTATGSGFDTGNIAGGASDSVTFQSAGSFDYVCSIHPQMTGTVVVQAAGGGGGGGGGGGAGATAPPTDTATGGHDPDSGWLTATLAILGLVMVAGTVATDLFLRRRSKG
jgi:plastocyanin